MLQVIAENLAENAIRYAGEGATCTLSCSEDGTGAAVLTASDDGAGVAEEDLPRLFERFYRADRARSTHGHGARARDRQARRRRGRRHGRGDARHPAAGSRVRCAFPAAALI